MDLVDVIWRGPYDAWTLRGTCSPGEKLPVQVPREQAETSDHFEIIEPKSADKPGTAANPITVTTDTGKASS